MTEPAILDDAAVSEIEDRVNTATPGPWGVLPSNNSTLAHVETQEGTAAEQGQGFTVCSIPKKRIDDAEFIAHAREDIPALCATVKHLRSEVAEYERTDLVPRSRYNVADAEAREAREQTKQLAHRAGEEIESLQSQLEQLRTENELLKIASADPADKEYGATVYDCKGNYTVLAQNAIDRNLSELRTRAIQLCKDKAADLNREVNKVDPDDDPTYFQVLAARIATAVELATELEKL